MNIKGKIILTKNKQPSFNNKFSLIEKTLPVKESDSLPRILELHELSSPEILIDIV